MGYICARRWVHEIYGFVLVYSDAGDNEDCRFEDRVIFKELIYSFVS
jgi:hypothetical protein